MRSKNPTISKFWKIYLAVVISVLVIIGASLAYLWHVMNLYEQSTPAYAMQALENVYSKDEYIILAQNSEIEDSAYESNDVRSKLFQSRLQGGELKSTRFSQGGSDTEQMYQVKAGDEIIGSFSLVFVDEGMFGYWRIEKPKITPKMWGNLTVTIPQNANLTVNGVPVQSSDITQENLPYELLRNLPDDITKPGQKCYEIKNLMAQPTLSVTDEHGNVLETLIEQKDVHAQSVQQEQASLNSYVGIVNLSVERDNSQELKDMALRDSENYSRFLSNDNKFSQISPRLMYGSQIYRDLSIMETMFYTPHTRVSFTEPVADNIIYYNDDIFSIDTNYIYTVYRGEDRPYIFDTSLTLVYVKYNDNWRIGDIKILS